MPSPPFIPVTMSTRIVKTFQLTARRSFSSVGYRKPYNNNFRSKPAALSYETTSNPWDHVYGVSSVLSALKAKKRQTLDTVYIQETDEKKTTQKKDASLLSEILSIAKANNIHAVAVDKGRLNNLTDSKPHQGVVLKASPRNPIEISALSAPNESGCYEASPRINKRGSEQEREKNKTSTASVTSIQFKTPASRMPFWIALDEVQDPQVSSRNIWRRKVYRKLNVMTMIEPWLHHENSLFSRCRWCLVVQQKQCSPEPCSVQSELWCH